MPRPERTLVATLLVDLVALGAAFGGAFRLHFSDRLFALSPASAQPRHYLEAVAVLLPAWLVVYALRGLYRAETMRHGTRLEALVVDATTLAAVLTLAGMYLMGAVAYSRGWLVMAWAAALLLTVAGRRVLLAVTRRRTVWRVLLAGASQTGVAAAETLGRDPRYAVVGFLDDYLPLGTWVAGQQVLGRPAQVAAVTLAARVDEVLVVDGALGRESYEGLLRDRYTTPGLPPVRLLPSTAEALVVSWEVTRRGGVTLWSPELGRIAGTDRVAKAMLDRVVAALVLVVASPLFLVAGLWSWRHRRPLVRGSALVGRGGRRFLRWSLAAWWAADRAVEGTLRYDAGPAHVGLAPVVRKLPRAWNVLRGELSLVGPRPILEEDLDVYRNVAGVLLAMKPGLVGPWLLHGDSDLTPEEELAADLAYVRGHTLGTDLTILARSSRQLWRRFRRQQAVAVAEATSRGRADLAPAPISSTGIDSRDDVRQRA